MQQQGGGNTWTQTDSLIAGLLVGSVGVSIVFWLAGQISAVLTGNNWPETNIGQTIGVAFGILRRPLEPRSAWPGPVQDAIPAAPIYYFVLALMVAGGVFGGIWIVRFFRDATSGGGGGGRGGLGQEKASWARRGSLKTLVVPGPEKGRLVLGKAQGKLVASEPRQSCIVMGPSQSGKTTGLAIPAILEWEGPVIATSVKTDLARDTLDWRKKTGKVWVYDPTKATSLPSATWSPLDGARTWGGAKKIASWLVGAGQGEKSGLNDAQFWYTAAGKLLAPHLFAAAANGYTMADVVRWIDTQEDFELRALLQATGVEEAIQAAEASWQREERARSSIYTTAEVVIEAYSDPTVLESAASSAIQPESFFDGGYHTLYVCAPGHEQNRLRPVFSTMLKQFITAAYEKSSAQGGTPLDPPLLIVLDEAANIAPLTDLDAIASTAAGHGIQLLTVWQDLSQIKARYADRAQTVINNHRAKIVLSGISDTESLDYVSRLIGSEEVKQVSFTTDAEGRKQKTESKGDKNLAPSDVLRRIKPNEGVLVYGALLPSRLVLRPWYKNRVLRARAQGLSEARSAFAHADFRGAGEVAADTIGRVPGADVLPGAVTAAALPEANPAGYQDPLASANPYAADPFGQRPAYGQPASYGQSNPYMQPPSYAQPNPYAPPSAYGQPPAGGVPAAGGQVPPIEDLFDFSDFADWDDDESDDETAGPSGQLGRFGAPQVPDAAPINPYVPQDPNSPSTASEQPTETRDRFAAAMDEWLKMFPESQRGGGNNEGQQDDESDAYGSSYGSTYGAPSAAPGYSEPGVTSSPFNDNLPSSSSPSSNRGENRDPEYEEFLAWKRQREESQAGAPPSGSQAAGGATSGTSSSIPSVESLIAQTSERDFDDESFAPKSENDIDYSEEYRKITSSRERVVMKPTSEGAYADAPLYGSLPARSSKPAGNGNGNGNANGNGAGPTDAANEDVIKVDEEDGTDDSANPTRGRYFSSDVALRGSVPAPRRPSSNDK